MVANIIGRAPTAGLYAVLVLSGSVAASAEPAKDGIYYFDIPRQDLHAALQTVALLSNSTLLYRHEIVAGIVSPPLDARLTVDQAIGVLLAGTELSYEITPAAVVLIRRKDSSRLSRVRNAVTAILAAIAAGGVNAQEAPSASQPALEEIMVTAQRREQNLQDVPISVTAVTGEAIAEAGFSDVEDMAAFVPNLIMRDMTTGQALIVRGIGTATGNEAFEQAVAFFSDGVFYSRDNLGQSAVFDLERVEVVRGPQPTFAGQSAVAGVINVITRKPGDTFEGMATASYGSGEESSLDAAIGGPVTDTIGVRVAARYYELGDTGYQSIVGRLPQGVKENTGARLTAVWTPSDIFNFTFKYEYQDVWQRGTPGEYTRCELRPNLSRANAGITPGLPALCALDVVVNGANLSSLNGERGTGGSLDARATVEALNAASGAMQGDTNFWGHYGTDPWSPARTVGMEAIAYGLNNVAEYNHPEDREFQADIAAGIFDWQIGSLSLSSIASFIQYDKEDWLDPDDSSFAIFNDHRQESFEQQALEIRLTSDARQTLSWMVGAYYQQHDMTTRIDAYLPRVQLAPALIHPGQTPRATAFGGALTEDSKWLSAFFAATWNVNDVFRVNFGGRYQDAEKHGRLPAEVAYLPINSNVYTPFFPFLDGRESRGTVETSDFLPEFGLEWNISDEVMTYVKYAEAFKNGGFVMTPPIGGGLPPAFTYLPEFAEGYELGFKSTLYNGRLELNAAAYYTKYTNLQSTALNVITNQVIINNAAEAHTQGIEIDGRAALTDRLTLGFSGAIAAEAEYDSFRTATCNSLETKMRPSPCRADRSGVSLTYSPRWSFTFNPDYRIAVGAGYQLVLGSSIHFMAAHTVFTVNEDPIYETGGSERIDARLAFAPMNDHWEVALYGRNLTDNRLQISGQPDLHSKSLDPLLYDAGGSTRERGARYGAQLTYRFGN